MNGTVLATSPSAPLLMSRPNTRSRISACSSARFSLRWKGGSYKTASSSAYVGLDATAPGRRNQANLLRSRSNREGLFGCVALLSIASDDIVIDQRLELLGDARPAKGDGLDPVDEHRRRRRFTRSGQRD